MLLEILVGDPTGAFASSGPWRIRVWRLRVRELARGDWSCRSPQLASFGSQSEEHGPWCNGRGGNDRQGITSGKDAPTSLLSRARSNPSRPRAESPRLTPREVF